MLKAEYDVGKVKIVAADGRLTFTGVDGQSVSVDGSEALSDLSVAVSEGVRLLQQQERRRPPQPTG